MTSQPQPPSWQRPSTPARSFPPPSGERATALDATLGALVAEGATGASPPESPRRGGGVVVAAGVLLVVAAGLGGGWALGRATNDDESSSATTIASVPGEVGSAANGNSGAAAVATTRASVVTVASSAPDVAADSTDPVSPTTATNPVAATSSPAAVAPSTSQPTAPATTAPSPATTAPAPVTSDTTVTTVGAPPVSSDDAGAPVPTLAPIVEAKLPNAVAYLQDGKVTLRGVFTDQAGLSQAIDQLTPIAPNGLIIEATVDPNATGGSAVPIVVPGAALFASGSALLDAAATPSLDQIAMVLVATPDARLTIRGHTDARGSDAYNYALSQQRVAAVFAYLTGLGLEAGRFDLEPRGEVEPVASNDTPEGQSLNRRVELIFTSR